MSHNNLDCINYKKYLKEIINVEKIFKKLKMPLCLHGGTLLGAIRNKDFIKGDDDIDIFYISLKCNLYEVLKEFDETIKPKLISKGYTVSPISWTVNGNKKKLFGQYHISKNNITLDLWSSWFEVNKFFLSPYIFGSFNKKDILPLKKCKIKNKYFNIPNNSILILELLYGKNWEIPANYRAKPNHRFFQLNILKIIDEYGWAYHFIGKEQQKYSIHNIVLCRLANFKYEILKDIDIVYFHSPGMSFNTINKTINAIRQQYPKIKIIGAYAGENNLKYTDLDLVVSISAKYIINLKNIYLDKPIIFLPESVDDDFFKPSIITKNNREFIPGYAGRTNKIKRIHIIDSLDFTVKKQIEHGKQFFNENRSLEPMLNFYHSIDCLILASSSECMPRVALEAMACGLPIISTDVGSMRLLVDKEWLTDVIDEIKIKQELNKRLILLNKYPDLRKEIGNRNRKHIEKYFSWSKNQILWDMVFIYLKQNDFIDIANATSEFNKTFYELEPCLYKETKYIEEHKLAIVAKSNKEIINEIVESQINFWLVKTTCKNCIIGDKLDDSILEIGVENEEIKEKLLSIYKDKIDITVKPNQKTKKYVLEDMEINVPFPVVKYLETEFNKSWNRLKND